jgi:hypothetical protein
MQTTVIVGVLVLVLLLVVAAMVAVSLTKRRRRTQQLQAHFGPEYEHAVREHGERGRAEDALIERTQRVERLNIRDLSPAQSARYGEAWRGVQSRFVDEPNVAIGEADRLVSEVMQERGYPMGEFEQRAADVSVDHPRVVENYRAAHTIASKADRGEASTEDLRQAMVHYRALFEELIGAREPVGAEAKR